MGDAIGDAMAQSDAFKMVGQITLTFEAGKASLILSGPDWPADGINPTVALELDPGQARVRLRAGVTTTPRLDDGIKVTKDDEDHLVELTALSDELKTLVGHGAYRGGPVKLATPQCSFLFRDGRYMTYREYEVSRRAAGPVVGALPGIAGVNVDRILYPPLTPAMFKKLIDTCFSKRMMALPTR